MGQLYLIPTQVRHYVLRYIRHALPRHYGQSQGRVDQRFAEFGLCGILLVDVDGRRVHGEERKPQVVGGNDRASQGMLVDISHHEVLKESTLPTVRSTHRIPRPCFLSSVWSVPTKSLPRRAAALSPLGRSREFARSRPCVGQGPESRPCAARRSAWRSEAAAPS